MSYFVVVDGYLAADVIITLLRVSVGSGTCYISVMFQLNRSIKAFLFIVSIVWQTLLIYIPLHPVFISAAWVRANYISSLLIMPIMYDLIKRFHNTRIRITVLQELGKASLNVYLTQKVFYGSGAGAFGYRTENNMGLQLNLRIALYCISGYVYYRIETPVTGRIIADVKNIDIL